MRPPATTVRLAEDVERWAALGFAISGGSMALGDLAVRFEGGRGGVAALEVHGLRAEWPDGLPIVEGERAAVAIAAHPLGAVAVDHLVVLTAEFAATVGALEAAGLDLRRRREPPDSAVRQAFFNLNTTILEVGEVQEPRGPARFWGMTIVVEDLDAAAARLGRLLGTPREAVQPGRRIATVRRAAGLGLAVALMTPRVRTR